MSRAASWARKAVATPTSSMLTRLRAGALALALSSNASNSGIPEAARVASGPGEIDYRLARQAMISEFRKGRLAQHEVCDAHPELRRMG